MFRLDAGIWLFARRLQLDPWGWIWFFLAGLLLVAVLRRLETRTARQLAAGSSTNKVTFLCKFGVATQGMEIPSSGHGDLEDVDRHGSCCCSSILQQGSSEAAPGSASMAAFLRLPSKMVKGRPLPPSSSATVLSGRRLKAKNNLQAAMPRWRPLCSGTVSSRCFAPSGSIPGGGAFGCAVVLRRGGEGAGPDGVSRSRSRVLCLYCQDLFVISTFNGPSCICCATALNESF